MKSIIIMNNEAMNRNLYLEVSMNQKMKKLLEGKEDNYILPFFWQHGESEEVLRKYMKVIEESNIKAVCVESRPHPDFCGPKWWQDMDVILEEAKARDMKVWILDDSHFPTGFANGAMAKEPDENCRQGICCRIYECSGKEELHIKEEELLHPLEWKPSYIEQYVGVKDLRRFDDDRLLAAFAVRRDENGFAIEGGTVDLKELIRDQELRWKAPEGRWKVYLLHLSRNVGCHRSYINMMDQKSCRILIDAVYEPHFNRYKEEFGKTIAGFFSDEPELGNGHLYEQGLLFGSYEDLPWSRELEEVLRESLGADYTVKLALLWEEEAPYKNRALVRYAYMDAVTKLVKQNFSLQIGDWCRAHGVQYIGHVIEDNNQHARLGSSLGHYYRGLAGQDMAGIDDIGGQVLPGQEDVNVENDFLGRRIGEFYHYMLGKLGSSAAAIEPRKNGNSMCEIFGAYGWSAGVRLEKYLVDHFLVRGINHYVPHAFSPGEFPDKDCPPHFYAHGNNPQYRHFGSLMAYTNRVCELINGGRHIASAAILYHGEAEWTGRCMLSHKIGHILTDAQIEYDYIPQDVFACPTEFRTVISQGCLKVNTQEYETVIVPSMQFVTKAFAEAAVKMQEAGIQVLFTDEYPEGICDKFRFPELTDGLAAELVEKLHSSQLVKLTNILNILKGTKTAEISIKPENNRIRYYHYIHEDHSDVYLLVNEGNSRYTGEVCLPGETGSEYEKCYLYDAWENAIIETAFTDNRLKVEIDPLKSLILIIDRSWEASDQAAFQVKPPGLNAKLKIHMEAPWKRAVCRSIDYPAFKDYKEISLPDQLAEEMPEFSGFVRYENTFTLSHSANTVLEITDAHEGVEVFISGKTQNIQIVPPFLYDISRAVKSGENQLVIEVATTLEREMSQYTDYRNGGVNKEPASLSGITGRVNIITG